MPPIHAALDEYLADWQAWTAAQSYAFGQLRPMHLGWKVADESALSQTLAELMADTQQGHIGTVDQRKIVLLALKQAVNEVPVLQIMQRRPGSTDPLGFDHVAFYCPDQTELEQFLEHAQIRWEHQSNPGHAWISLWFGPRQREAKFFDHTSLDLGARELHEASAAIKAAGTSGPASSRGS